MISVDVKRVLRTAIALSTEKDRSRLLELIIAEAMEIAHADAGTLYIYSYEEDCLRLKNMRNHTMKFYQGGHGEDVNPTAVLMSMEDICTYAALTRKTINVTDIYHCGTFDFTNSKRFDKLTGYHTQSMLVIPFVNNKDEVVGVLQLINCIGDSGQVMGFSKDLEMIMAALASQAAVAITNSMYLADIKALFNSFVQVMISAIDERSPYNVHHTRKMAEYAERFTGYLNRMYAKGFFEEQFDENRTEQFVMATWMHDIGKIVTPIEVMNKSTRLAAGLEIVLMRFDMHQATLRIAYLEGRLCEQAYQEQLATAQTYRELVQISNESAFLDGETVACLEHLRGMCYVDLQGVRHPLLTDNELAQIQVRQGTLTYDERQIMQDHVKVTRRLLSKIRFGRDLANVPEIASMHHEYLDGSGYPDGIMGAHLPLEARMLSILDIYEALTSFDRPYKKPMSQETSFRILREMAGQGKLDSRLVELFAGCMLEAEGTEASSAI